MQYHSARAIVSINTTSIASKAFHTVQKDKYLSDFDVFPSHWLEWPHPWDSVVWLKQLQLSPKKHLLEISGFGRLGPFWSILDHWDHFGPLWAIFGTVWTWKDHYRPVGPLWTVLDPSWLEVWSVKVGKSLNIEKNREIVFSFSIGLLVKALFSPKYHSFWPRFWIFAWEFGNSP